MKAHAVNVDTENIIIIDNATELPSFDAPHGMETHMGELTDEAAESAAERILSTAQRQADEILRQAHANANSQQDAIIKKAEAEAINITTEAWDKAYADGMAIATVEGDTIKAEAAGILEAAKAERKAMQDGLEPEMVALIITIIEKLLGDIVDISPGVVINLIKQGLSDTSLSSGTVKIYISDTDYDNVKAREAEIAKLTDGSVTIEIAKDTSLNPTDCVIETPFGDIDVSLDGQLSAVKASLKYILDNR
jgi:flagellar assembly protein FliH